MAPHLDLLGSCELCLSLFLAHTHRYIDTHRETSILLHFMHMYTHTHTTELVYSILCSPEQMTVPVWDYVFYGGDLPQTDISPDALRLAILRMRSNHYDKVVHSLSIIYSKRDAVPLLSVTVCNSSHARTYV